MLLLNDFTKIRDPLIDSPLGRKSPYINTYRPELLFSIPRSVKREEIAVPLPLPFVGDDIWNAYELSWLNPKGKPVVAIAEFRFPCESPFLIESKSFKLYLNSLNNTPFDSTEAVMDVLQADLSRAAGVFVGVTIRGVNQASCQIHPMEGECLDELDIQCTSYLPDSDFLETFDDWVEETIHSNLLKSNCLVTGQPDWASIQIRYYGKKIYRDGLLKYLISLRDHNEFHEQCTERIFMDILNRCRPDKLLVYSRYTRRGGLDINPVRTNTPEWKIQNTRNIRQ